MTVAAAVGIVLAIVQFTKAKLLPSIIQGPVAVVFTVLVSVGVTLYKYVAEGLPINFGAIMFCIQVIVGAMGAYGLVKVASGKTE